MTNISPFCTCTNLRCPLHPTKHARGCAPCIEKNLRLGEVPNCFFHKLPNAPKRTGDTFQDFAETVLANCPHHEDSCKED